MAKKRKRGGVSKLPVRRPRARRVGEDRKLSEIIKEMALRLLKDPDATPSAGAAEAALLLASASWNSASDDPNFQNQHREALKNVDWGKAVPWAELCSTGTERLIAGLVEYCRRTTRTTAGES